MRLKLDTSDILMRHRRGRRLGESAMSSPTSTGKGRAAASSLACHERVRPSVRGCPHWSEQSISSTPSLYQPA